MSKLHPIFEQALAPFLKPVATRNDTPCGCDEDRMCEEHALESMREHAWMRNVSIGAVTGVMSEADKDDLRAAGRGHLVRL